MLERKFYVYEHWRTDRNECFYVGKGHGRRAYDMRRGRNRFHKFIQLKLTRLGCAIEVKIVADQLTEQEAFDLEMQRIAFWKNDGADLANLTDGGEGTAGLKHSEEWKQAMSQKLKGRKLSVETKKKISEAAIGNKNGLGAKRPQDAIEKTAVFHRGRKRSAETVEKIRTAKLENPPFKGKHHTLEIKKKISEANKGQKRSEETRAKMRKPKSEAHKRKLSAVNLGKTHSEETRRKLSDIAKADWQRRKALLIGEEK